MQHRMWMAAGWRLYLSGRNLGHHVATDRDDNGGGQDQSADSSSGDSTGTTSSSSMQSA